jgi:hypothetical protein
MNRALARTRTKWLRWLLFETVVLLANTASGESVIVKALRPDADVNSAIVRIQAELTTAGFEVAKPSTDTESRVFATVVVFRDGRTLVARVVAKRVKSGVAVERDIPARLDDTSALGVLAVRIREHLRATLVDFGTEATRAPASAPGDRSGDRSVPTTEDRAPHYPLAISGGGAVLSSLGGVPALVAPSLAWSFLPHPTWRTELRFTGPTVPASIATEFGRVEIHEQLFTLEGHYRLRRDDQHFIPALFVGFGVLHVSVRGDPVSPNLGSDASVLAAVFGAGAEVSWKLARRFALRAGAAALFAEPRGDVQAVGQSVATVGRPLLLARMDFELCF